MIVLWSGRQTQNMAMPSPNSFLKIFGRNFPESPGFPVEIYFTLELGVEHSEQELEKAILARVGLFLCEMGGNLAFMGSRINWRASKNE